MDPTGFCPRLSQVNHPHMGNNTRKPYKIFSFIIILKIEGYYKNEEYKNRIMCDIDQRLDHTYIDWSDHIIMILKFGFGQSIESKCLDSNLD